MSTLNGVFERVHEARGYAKERACARASVFSYERTNTPRAVFERVHDVRAHV